MIEYKTTHEFKEDDLKQLFQSVGWESAQYPKKLVAAMKNYETVFSAWDGDRLVGLVSAMDDGIMTSYVHYVLTDPEYQKSGIGGKLMEMLKEKYKDYLKIVLVSYTEAEAFYKKYGFEIAENSNAMYYTNWQ